MGMRMGTSNGTVTPSSTKTRQKAETQTPELVSPKRNRGKREELGWTLASMVDGRWSMFPRACSILGAATHIPPYEGVTGQGRDGLY